MDYLTRSKHIMPLNKRVVIHKIKSLIQEYLQLRDTLTMNARVQYIEHIMLVTMNEPELLARYPKIRKVFKNRYNILKQEISIKDVASLLSNLKKRSDYVAEKSTHTYNLRSLKAKG